MKTKQGKKVRYAVVGLGHLAQVAVLPGFKHAQNSTLVALVSEDPKKLAKLSRQYKVDRLYSYDQYEECLSHGMRKTISWLPWSRTANFHSGGGRSHKFIAGGLSGPMIKLRGHTGPDHTSQSIPK